MTDYATGFMRLPREAVEAIGANPITLSVYIELLTRARWEGPVTRTTSHGVVDLDVGQCYFGRGELAESIGATEQRVRTALRHLETIAILTTTSTKRGTVATLVGYKESIRHPTAEQPSRQPTINQRSTTTKNEDQSPDLSFSDLAEADPDHGGGRDHEQRRGHIGVRPPHLVAVPTLVEPRGLDAFAEAMRIANGGKS